MTDIEIHCNCIERVRHHVSVAETVLVGKIDTGHRVLNVELVSWESPMQVRMDFPHIEPSRMCPRPIRNDGELYQAIARLDDLDRRDEDLTPEERELAELYTALIEAYEGRHYAVPHAPPHEFLRALLEQRGLAQADIAHLLGGSGHASEILNAKRSISKVQAKKLAGFFNLPADLFI